MKEVRSIIALIFLLAHSQLTFAHQATELWIKQVTLLVQQKDESALQKQIIDRIKLQIEGYFRAHTLMKQFDQEIASNKSDGDFHLMESKSYQNLLKLRDIIDTLEEKILAGYKQLLYIANIDKTFSLDEKKVARSAISKIHLFFHTLSEEDQYALERLTSQMNEIRIQMASNINGMDREAQLRAVPYQSVKDKLDKKAEKINTQLPDKEIGKILDEDWSFPVEPQLTGEKNDSFSKIQLAWGSNIYGYEMPANSGNWALTFDDGPSGTLTPQLLNDLQSLNMKVTFFTLAQQAKAYPAIIARQVADGHQVANHSYTHANLPKLDAAGLKHEIIDSTQVLRGILGLNSVKFFRCPYGAGFKQDSIKNMIAGQKMVHVFWSVDTLDWQDKNPESIIARAQKQMELGKNRGIILFHDIHPQSIKASMELVRRTKDAKWLRLDEIVAVPTN